MDTCRNFSGLRASALAVSLALGGASSQAAEPPQGPMFQVQGQLLNAEIKNSVGEELGEIEDLVVDGQGRIQYLVIEHGGFLDIGDEVVAVPWRTAAVQMGEDGHVIVDLTRADLAKAPRFRKDQWPDMQAQAWHDEVRTFTDTYAETHDAKPRQDVAAFDALDVNEDGHVSPAEANARQIVSARFQELDRNGDGQLSRWEFNTFEKSMADSEFPSSPSERARAQLTEEQQQQRREIERTNREQNITPHVGKSDASGESEQQQAKSEQKPKQQRQQDAEQAMQQAKKTPAQKSFAELDKDGNGKLSRQEVEAAGGIFEQPFVTVDVNDDGAIDRSEFSAFEREAGAGQSASPAQDPAQAPAQDATPR